jgi:hypothetical protein
MAHCWHEQGQSMMSYRASAGLHQSLGARPATAARPGMQRRSWVQLYRVHCVTFTMIVSLYCVTFTVTVSHMPCVRVRLCRVGQNQKYCIWYLWQGI